MGPSYELGTVLPDCPPRSRSVPMDGGPAASRGSADSPIPHTQNEKEVLKLLLYLPTNRTMSTVPTAVPATTAATTPLLLLLEPSLHDLDAEYVPDGLNDCQYDEGVVSAWRRIGPRIVKVPCGGASETSLATQLGRRQLSFLSYSRRVCRSCALHRRLMYRPSRLNRTLLEVSF